MIYFEGKRTVIDCTGDIAVTLLHELPEHVIWLSDDYGQHEPGEDMTDLQLAKPVPLGSCGGVLIIIRDARSARTFERAARICAA